MSTIRDLQHILHAQIQSHINRHSKHAIIIKKTDESLFPVNHKSPSLPHSARSCTSTLNPTTGNDFKHTPPTPWLHRIALSRTCKTPGKSIEGVQENVAVVLQGGAAALHLDRMSMLEATSMMLLSTQTCKQQNLYSTYSTWASNDCTCVMPITPLDLSLSLSTSIQSWAKSKGAIWTVLIITRDRKQQEKTGSKQISTKVAGKASLQLLQHHRKSKSSSKFSS